MNSNSLQIALVGNPNCGKTALFNQLTGARQKVANYAGVTVERKSGSFIAPSGRNVRILDLPGTYSFQPVSLEEKITQTVLQGKHPGEPIPDLIICVVDATNLRLHLRFVLEVLQLGRPVVLALNMVDVAKRQGIGIDVGELSKHLGITVVETVAVKRGGAQALADLIGHTPLTAPATVVTHGDLHEQVRRIIAAAVSMPIDSDTRDDAIDRVVLHPTWGLILLALVMFIVFQAVYAIGKPLTDLIADGVGNFGSSLGQLLPEGPLRGLATDGLIGGLGSVLSFLPQILVLFFFILVLEESGYLPRAAFLLDRVMVAVGLSGRSFIPLLSSFACAIPGIMGTRSITDSRDRMATILVAPLMTCSARLPVYTLLIGAFIPARPVLGIFNLQGAALFALYFAGIAAAMLVAWIAKLLGRTQQERPLLMELPGYRLPNVRDVAIGLWERAWIFLKRLTGVMLALTVLMWFICNFPSPPPGATDAAIDYSLAGMLGRALQFIFAPLGFNWQISLSLIPAFAARETAVATLATIYAVGSGDETDSTALMHALAGNISLASALSLMVWFAFAPQCMSTLAIIRRETKSWKMVAASFGYMFVLAYLASFATYHLARLLA